MLIFLSGKLERDLEKIYNSPMLDDLFKGKKLSLQLLKKLYYFIKACSTDNDNKETNKQEAFKQCQKVGLEISEKSINKLITPLYCLQNDGHHYKYIMSQSGSNKLIEKRLNNIESTKRIYFVDKNGEAFTDIDPNINIERTYYDYSTCMCYVITIFSLKNIEDKISLKELCYSIDNNTILIQTLTSVYGSKLQSVDERTVSSETNNRREQNLIDCIHNRTGNFYFYFREQDCTIIFVQRSFLSHPSVKNVESKWEEILEVIESLPLVF